MNKIYKVFALSMVALIGLSMTGCSEDNLDTNPYNKSGVNLVAFGPSPILRTHEIRITGTNLTNVTSVAFPGNAVVEKGSFNSVDNQNIYVNVPDASVPGKIKLLVGSDTVATSVSPITFEEPITIASVSPTSGLNAGDEITVKGEYVYNIAEVIFTSGVVGAPVTAEEFTYVSRKEIRLQVPLAAESGVITFNDGAEWEFEYETPVEITAATYTGLSNASTDFGQQIQIMGTNLHTVETVMFPGGTASEFVVSDDHKSITTSVPEVTKPGQITLVLYSGASLTTDEFSVPVINITDISKSTDLKVGDEVTITGENFDRVTAVTLPSIGDFTDYTVSGNTLSFTVPEGMGDGKIVLTQNSLISVETKVSMYNDSNETAIWADEFVCSGWNGNQDLAWGGFDWTTIAAGTTINFYYKKNNPGSWGCISLRHGDSWANLPDPIPGQYDLDDDEGVLKVTFPQNVLDDINANGGLVITGDNYTLTRVTIPASELTLWQGEAVADDWGNQPSMLSDGGAELIEAGAKAGSILRIYLTPTDETWNCQVWEGHWGHMFDDCDYSADNYNLAEHNGALEIKLTADMLAEMTTAGGWGGAFLLNGDNVICTKVTIE